MVEQDINQAKLEEKVVNERTEKEKASTEKLLKLWSAAIGIFLIIALFVIKIQNPEFPLMWVLIIGAVVVVICLFIFFSFNIFRMFNKKEDEDGKKLTEKGLPQPASLATLRGLAEQALTNKHFNNHTTICIREYYDNAGRNKDRIYIYKTKALYNSHMKEGIVYIIINTHFPTDLRTILIDPTPTELHKAINSIASSPLEEPDVEETQVFNPLTNTIINTRKVENPKEQVKKEEPKKGDLE